MAVSISGMFGDEHTYFSDSPVVIDISGLQWSQNGRATSSPFTIVRVEVLYEGNVVGDFRADTGGQTSISFDISSALRSIWSDYDFNPEVSVAQTCGIAPLRPFREYSIAVYTEYLDSNDGEFTSTHSGTFSGGRCTIGRLTEWERSTIGEKENADVSHWEHTNMRNGDASTKPQGSTPERVGATSITSWVDVNSGGTQSIFYPPNAENGIGSADAISAHAPYVMRDTFPYIDFLFVNRRGALETCSAPPLEAMNIDIHVEQFARIESPSFSPSRSLMAIGSDGRRSWNMSSGHQTREWADWWAMDFLTARQWWMLYKGRYVPVIIEPAKTTHIYDRSKQQMPSVDFTVTLALEG